MKLKAFSKFENTTEALQAAASLVDSKLSKGGWRPAPWRPPARLPRNSRQRHAHKPLRSCLNPQRALFPLPPSLPQA